MAESSDRIEKYFKALGERIHKFRTEKGFTLEEVGLRIGLDKSNMHKIEVGQPINIKTILKLALVLERPPKDFLDFKFDLEIDDLPSLSKGSLRKKASTKKKKK